VLPNGDNEVDGYCNGKSILLGEPRIRARFIVVEGEGIDETNRPIRPPVQLLICRGFVLFLSFCTLVAGIIAKAVLQPYADHVQKTS